MFAERGRSVEEREGGEGCLLRGVFAERGRSVEEREGGEECLLRGRGVLRRGREERGVC